MNIEGVSTIILLALILYNLLMSSQVGDHLGISFKNSRELNKIIDSKLPGRPSFVCKEIMVGSEVCELYFCDIAACVKSLSGDPNFAPYLVFQPEKHYTNEIKEVHMFHDMHTSHWWWSTQVSVNFPNITHVVQVRWYSTLLFQLWLQDELQQLNPGATIFPIIISSDKTLLTLFRNKTAYPVYMTIGNIPKEICRKPSCHAYVLLAYLPTTWFENVTNKAFCRRLLANMYHACMSKILEPLQSTGVNGIDITSGDGNTYHDIHSLLPLLATIQNRFW